MTEAQDPFRAQSFYLDLGSIYRGPILKISGLGQEREVKTIQQATTNGRTIINSLPGRYTPKTLTVQKAITADKGFWDWRKKVLADGDISKVRTNGTVEVSGDGGATLRWNLLGVWPSRIKGPMLDVAGDKAYEEIELCYETLEQVEM
jgi:phage tail-like protein